MADYLTTNDAAILFGVTPRTVRRWVEKRELIPDVWGEHGGTNPHKFLGKTLQNYILSKRNIDDDALEPSEQLALARTEEVRLKNEQTKENLINRAEFEADYYARLGRVVSAFSQLPDEILAIDRDELTRATLEELINSALAYAYQAAVKDD